MSFPRMPRQYFKWATTASLQPNIFNLHKWWHMSNVKRWSEKTEWSLTPFTPACYTEPQIITLHLGLRLPTTVVWSVNGYHYLTIPWLYSLKQFFANVSEKHVASIFRVKEYAKLCHLLSRWFLAWLILRPWRWRWHVPSKRLLTFNRLHGFLSKNIERTLHNHRHENFKTY
jgi:hypothetical protein